MRRCVLAILSVCLIAATAGCGGGGGGDGDDGNGDGNGGGGNGNSVKLETFAQKSSDLTASTICNAAFDCPRKQGTGIVQFLSRFLDKANCTDKLLSSGGPFDAASRASQLQSQVDKGLMEYDAEQAAQCLDALEKRIQNNKCAGPDNVATNEMTECEGVLTGTQKEGEPCSADNHCQSGYCNLQGGDSNTCYGACGAEPTAVGAGESCGPSTPNRCESGSDLLCTAPEGAQPTCTKERSVAMNDSCGNSRVCQENLTCISDTCQSLTLNGQGESCSLQDSTAGCQPGLTCHIDSISGGQITAACDQPQSEGESCYTSLECKHGLYCEGADLGSMTRGSCAPQKAAGESCTQGQPALECNSLSCQNGTCASAQTCEVPNDDGS